MFTYFGKLVFSFGKAISAGPSGATRRAGAFGKLSLATLAAHVVPAGPLATLAALAALAVLQVLQALLFSSTVPREWWGGQKE